MMDNAENNAVAMKELQELLNKKKIQFDHKKHRIGCYPHIINICVSHIISSLTKFEAADLNNESDDEADNDGDYVPGSEDEIQDNQYEDLEEWFKNVKRDAVKRVCKMVRTVQASGPRREGLLLTIVTGNTTGLFKDAEGARMEIRDLQLIRDVRHHWDSL